MPRDYVYYHVTNEEFCHVDKFRESKSIEGSDEVT